MASINQPLMQKNFMLSQFELLRRIDPTGKAAAIAEVLNENNEVLQDVVFKEGNLPTGDEQTIRTGLPDVYWRQLNRGVPASHSTTASVTETCAELAARSQLDVEAAKLNGLTAAFRASEDAPFIESMGQSVARELFYGDVRKASEGFSGLATRYSTTSLSKAQNAKNVIDCGGTGNKLTSIYIVGWGDNVYCPYPKGSALGLQSEDLGKQLIDDDGGNKYLAYVTMYSWKVGLMVRDWRYVVRLCNINPDELFNGTGIGSGDLKTANSSNLLLKLEEGLMKIPSGGRKNLVMYMNNDIHAGLNVVSARTNMQVVEFETGVDKYGKHSSWSTFKGIPMRRCDQIVNTEAQVK